MKVYIIILGFVFSTAIKAQAQNSPSETVANRMALKMKDSLGLSNSQKDAVYNANMQINGLKSAARSLYNNADSIRFHLQMAENMRDSLYRMVLPYNKYQIYKQRKIILLSNN